MTPHERLRVLRLALIGALGLMLVVALVR